MKRLIRLTAPCGDIPRGIIREAEEFDYDSMQWTEGGSRYVARCGGWEPADTDIEELREALREYDLLNELIDKSSDQRLDKLIDLVEKSGQRIVNAARKFVPKE